MKFAGFLLGGVAAIVVSSATIAADVPVRGPVYTKAPPAFSWEGQYVGIHGGYFWGDNGTAVGVAVADAPTEPRGGYGGAQFGYLHHLSRNWVIGYEVDISFGSIDGSTAAAGGVTTDVLMFGTARTRLGYAQGPWLLYGTGGLAWAKTEIRTNGFVGERAQIGYAVGAGVEYAFAPNWSAKLEYLYLDLGENIVPNLFIGRTDLTASTLRLGLNYRFANWNSAPGYSLPVKAPVRSANWTGPYVGIHGAYVTGDHFQIGGVTAVRNEPSGGVFGFQTGYNWQPWRNNWVVGLEADSSWGSVNDGGALVTDIDAMGTVRARLGYAMNNWLLYGTGGLAWMHVDSNFAVGGVIRDQYYLGWTGGVGVEYALSNKWSAQVEYRFSKFVDHDITVLNAFFKDNFDMHTIKFGVNYRAGIFDLIGMRWN